MSDSSASDNILKKLATKLSGDQKQSPIELEQHLDEVLSDQLDMIAGGLPHASDHASLHRSVP
jgi:hypothetical protein